MPRNLESINIDKLLAEAEELIQQINSDVIKKPLNKSRTLHQMLIGAIMIYVVDI